MRCLRHLRSSRSGQHDVLGPVRVAAPGPGERGNRGVRRSEGPHLARHGYVADTFNGDALSQLPGAAAIGHVRYSTAGESMLPNAQPILIECTHGQIAVGHNGNLVNATQFARRAGATGLDFSVELRHRSHRAPRGPFEGFKCRRGDRGRGIAGAGRFLACNPDARPYDRRPAIPMGSVRWRSDVSATRLWCARRHAPWT